MSEGPIQQARAALTAALAGLEGRLTELDHALTIHLAAPPPVDEALVARHDALKSEVAAVIAELDTMVGPAPGPAHG